MESKEQHKNFKWTEITLYMKGAASSSMPCSKFFTVLKSRVKRKSQTLA